MLDHQAVVNDRDLRATSPVPNQCPNDRTKSGSRTLIHAGRPGASPHGKPLPANPVRTPPPLHEPRGGSSPLIRNAPFRRAGGLPAEPHAARSGEPAAEDDKELRQPGRTGTSIRQSRMALAPAGVYGLAAQDPGFDESAAGQKRTTLHPLRFSAPLSLV
jgi:hypothetical protein